MRIAALASAIVLIACDQDLAVFTERDTVGADTLPGEVDTADVQPEVDTAPDTAIDTASEIDTAPDTGPAPDIASDTNEVDLLGPSAESEGGPSD